jgi:hypothetical protein
VTGVRLVALVFDHHPSCQPPIAIAAATTTAPIPAIAFTVSTIQPSKAPQG